MGLLDTLLGSRNAGGGYSGGLLSIPGQLAGGLLGSVITPVQRGLWGTSSQDIAAQRKQLLDQAQQDRELQRQLLQMQLDAAQTAQAQRGQDQQTALKFGDLLNQQGVRQWNAQNPGDLQMVENTAQRSGTQYPSLDALMATPSFSRIAEQNPRLKALSTPQKLGAGEIMGDPLSGQVIASNPKPQDLPDGMMYGANGMPQWVPGYITGKAQVAAAGRAPPTPSYSHVLLDNGNVGAFDSRTGRVSDTGIRGRDTASTKPPTEYEQKVSFLYDEMRGASDQLARLPANGTDTSNLGNAALGHSDKTAWMQSSAFKAYQAAAERWAQNYLYLKSGAQAPEQEVRRTLRMYFPAPGDDAATKQQKAQARAQAESSLSDMLATRGLLKTGVAAPLPAESGGEWAGIAGYMQKYGGR